MPENSTTQSAGQATRNNPLPILVAELEALIGDSWPGALRDLLDPEEPRPLVIGIFDQIAAGLDIDQRKALKRWFAKWCGTARYLHALKAKGAQRHGLDGTPTGPVDPDHVRGARERFSRRALRWKATAARQAPPPPPKGPNAARPTLRLGAPR
jgi:sRNA-binding protein